MKYAKLKGGVACMKLRKTRAPASYMRLMLVKGTGGRKLRCIDCGQPDPMDSADTLAWFKGELGSEK
jgi:hypothetical protein